MTKRDNIKKEIEEEDKFMGSGEGTLGSGSPDPESDDDVDEAYKAMVGHNPIAGEDLDDEVDAAEDYRRGEPAHEDELDKPNYDEE